VIAFGQDGTLTRDAKNALLQDARDAVHIAEYAASEPAVVGPLAAELLRQINQARLERSG
jgi:hypothetical protein